MHLEEMMVAIIQGPIDLKFSQENQIPSSEPQAKGVMDPTENNYEESRVVQILETSQSGQEDPRIHSQEELEDLNKEINEFYGEEVSHVVAEINTQVGMQEVENFINVENTFFGHKDKG